MSWIELLSTVLLGLRTTIKEDIKASAAELLYGTTLRIFTASHAELSSELKTPRLEAISHQPPSLLFKG
jgi:hypothetical protein